LAILSLSSTFLFFFPDIFILTTTNTSTLIIY
jgi:hypothetical protein